MKRNTPQDNHQYIDDQFKQISLYDMKINDSKMRETEQGKFEITLNVNAKKLSADGKGEETEQAFEDEVEIVLFSDDPNDFDADNTILYRQKHTLVSGENQLVFTTESLPAFVGVDPFVRFIDRDSKDNIAKL
jgi:ABC-2 type transport system permease protein